jgi:hypothetical protein
MKTLNNYINEALIKKDTKIDNHDYHFYDLYLPKSKITITYIDEDTMNNLDNGPDKGDEENFVQLQCTNKWGTINLSPKYIKVNDLLEYKDNWQKLSKIIYEFGKEQNKKVTDVDLCYWSKKEKVWKEFAYASKTNRNMIRPQWIEDEMKEKYPFN